MPRDQRGSREAGAALLGVSRRSVRGGVLAAFLLGLGEQPFDLRTFGHGQWCDPFVIAHEQIAEPLWALLHRRGHDDFAPRLEDFRMKTRLLRIRVRRRKQQATIAAIMARQRSAQTAIGRQALGGALFTVADKHIDEVLKSKLMAGIFK